MIVKRKRNDEGFLSCLPIQQKVGSHLTQEQLGRSLSFLEVSFFRCSRRNSRRRRRRRRRRVYRLLFALQNSFDQPPVAVVVPTSTYAFEAAYFSPHKGRMYQNSIGGAADFGTFCDMRGKDDEVRRWNACCLVEELQKMLHHFGARAALVWAVWVENVESKRSFGCSFSVDLWLTLLGLFNVMLYQASVTFNLDHVFHKFAICQPS